MWLPGAVTRVTLTVLCVCLSVPIVLCQDEETCTTVEGGIGKCAPLVVCAPYFTLLRQSQMIPLTVQFRDAQCAYEDNNPKVCCPLTDPEAVTPGDDADLNNTYLGSPTLGPSEDSLSKDVGGVDDKLEETCTTVEGGIGKCAPLVVCAPYFTLLRQSQTTPLTVQFRDAQCGYEDNCPKVCCPLTYPGAVTPGVMPDEELNNASLGPASLGSPTLGPSEGSLSVDVGGVNDKLEENCTTLEGDIGKCIPLYDCPRYFTLTIQPEQIREVECGYEDNYPKVCCPLPSSSTSPTRDAASAKSLSPSDFITAFPEPPLCGLTIGKFNRVVGGVNAQLGLFPSMALLGIRQHEGANPRWICGGSLISHHHVMTAAHCIKNELNVVRLGELDFERDDDGATPIDVPIKRKIKHENYNDPYFTNDIGLLILAWDVQFTKLISPLCIPERPDIREKSFLGYHPFLAGWGNTDNRGTSNSHLQVVQLEILENSYCEKAYESRVIDERVMCVGYVIGGKDSCTGDSGGPLMQPVSNATSGEFNFYQTGIVSYGHVTCGSPDSPGVYTRVAHFVPWLQKHVLGLEE